MYLFQIQSTEPFRRIVLIQSEKKGRGGNNNKKKKNNPHAIDTKEELFYMDKLWFLSAF